jgi:transcriptional regulator with XRE-family HTH domain
MEVEMAARPTITKHEEIRRQFGYTVTELAEAVGYSHAYVSQVEGGQTAPSPKYRRAVAELLEVPEVLLFPGGGQ